MKKKYTEWNAVFCGNAFEAAQELHDKTINIISGNITKSKDEKSGREYVRLNIFDFEVAPEFSAESESSGVATPNKIPNA